MRKIVINGCYGGFGLSYDAIMKYAELKGEKVYGYVRKDPITSDILEPYDRTKHGIKNHISYSSKKLKEKTCCGLNKSYWRLTAKRDDPFLIQVVEELGKQANSRFSELRIVEIPDDVKWEISEYDGHESVEEVHRSWS